VLRQESGSSNTKRYRFEVRWTEPALASSDIEPPPATSAMSTVAVPSAVVAAAITPPCSPQETVGGQEIAPNNSGNNESW